MKLLSRYSIATAVLIVFFTGCAYNPGPNDMGPGKTVPPKVGTVYIYNNIPIDTTGRLLTDSAYTTVDSIAATATTFSGKTNVTQISKRNLKTGLVTLAYINYETNGDISEYFGASVLSFLGLNLPDWVTYPMQSHTAEGSKVADTTIGLPFGGISVPFHIVVTDSLLYVNSGSFSLNQSSLAVFNLKHITHYDGTFTVIPGLPGTQIGTTGTTTLAFAPSIGDYAEIKKDPLIIPLGLFASLNGLDTKLVSFQLK